jgi:hypothetical protein
MAATARRYLYAVTEAEAQVDLSGLSGVAEPGGQAAALEIIPAGPLAAIASPFSGERIRPERRNLAAHQAALRALLDANIAFLPVSFGLMAPSLEDLAALLAANRPALLSDLARLAGKVEMGVKMAWDVENIFEFFVFRNPELAQLRDRLSATPGGPSTDEKIELGRTFEAMLNEARERHKNTIMRALGKWVVEFKADPPRDEKMILNLNCLVERDEERPFEKGVLQVASLFDDRYAFDYSGPWPPCNFVRVALRAPLAGRSAHRETTYAHRG